MKIVKLSLICSCLVIAPSLAMHRQKPAGASLNASLVNPAVVASLVGSGASGAAAASSAVNPQTMVELINTVNGVNIGNCSAATWLAQCTSDASFVGTIQNALSACGTMVDRIESATTADIASLFTCRPLFEGAEFPYRDCYDLNDPAQLDALKASIRPMITGARNRLQAVLARHQLSIARPAAPALASMTARSQELCAGLAHASEETQRWIAVRTSASSEQAQKLQHDKATLEGQLGALTQERNKLHTMTANLQRKLAVLLEKNTTADHLIDAAQLEVETTKQLLAEKDAALQQATEAIVSLQQALEAEIKKQAEMRK